MKRLAVFLDGTWNDPGDNTNVWRLRSMLSRTDEHGIEQLPYYDKGVGTKLSLEDRWIVPQHETIDASVFRKWADDDGYRPKNIAEWAARLGVDPATITTTQDALPAPYTSMPNGPTS